MVGKTGAILTRCCVQGSALLILTALATATYADGTGRTAAGPCRHASRVNAGPVVHCGMPAPSYPVPFATPRPNLQTAYKYPPMMPHNSLPHYPSTYAFRHGPGMSRTTVMWRPTTGLNALAFMHQIFELPR